MAAIEAEVSSEDRTWISADFNITDCNRKVAIDFYVHDKEDAERKREKIRKLRLAIVAFEKAFIAELDAKYPQK